jgi:hypothetical protein
VPEARLGDRTPGASHVEIASDAMPV